MSSDISRNKTKKKDSEELFIILDANSIMHRSYHAIPNLTTNKGELVNAVFGFTSILMTILTQEKPKYILAAFDMPAPTFRHKMYKEYKAGRKKTPDDFFKQIPRIKEILNTLNIPILEQEGVEADDIIGTIVKINEKNHKKLHNKIITSDMDAMQLVTNKTCVGNLYKGYRASECFYPEDVYRKYQLNPSQIIDYKALQGDQSDNIPGVKGIGKKGATELLRSYKSLDGVYNHIDEIRGKKKELLIEQKDQAYFSKKLATIKTDVIIKYEKEKCLAHDFNTKKMIQLLEELQFFSIIRRFQTWKKSHGVNKKEISEIFGNKVESKRKEQNPNQTSLF